MISQNSYSPKEIRDILIITLNNVAPRYGYDFAENSTRVITIKVKDYYRSRIIHSCDFAVVNNYSERGINKQQYIRFCKDSNSFVWASQSKGFYQRAEKIDWIKQNNLWEDLKLVYLDKKKVAPPPKKRR